MGGGLGLAKNVCNQIDDEVGIVEAIGANVSRLQGELMLMRTIVVGLSAALAAMLAVGVALLWSRRRTGTAPEGPTTEGALGR